MNFLEREIYLHSTADTKGCVCDQYPGDFSQMNWLITLLSENATCVPGPWPQNNALKSHLCRESSPHFSGRGTVLFLSVFLLPESFWLAELRTVGKHRRREGKAVVLVLWRAESWGGGARNRIPSSVVTLTWHIWRWDQGPWWQWFKEDVFRVAKIKKAFQLESFRPLDTSDTSHGPVCFLLTPLLSQRHPGAC